MKIGWSKWVLIFCAIALLGGVIVSPLIRSDGEFITAEYRITLRNQSGDLINDAQLIVRDSNGDFAERYPILEYNGNPVASNDEGVFVVHKVRSGLPFGRMDMNLFGNVPIGRKDTSAFEIVFLSDLKTIGKADFYSVDDGFDYSSAKRVRRTFTVAEIADDRMKANLSEKELSQVAIDEELPIVERTFTLKVVGHEPKLEEDAEIEASFAKLKPLLAKITKDTEFALYEGISRNYWDDKAEGKTHRRFRYEFYDIPHPVLPEKLNELRLILQNPNSFEKFSGAKACGGFRPDFSLLWNIGAAKFEILVCFGCHEIMAFAEGAEIYCDIGDEAYKLLKTFLSDYAIHRPKPDRG